MGRLTVSLTVTILLIQAFLFLLLAPAPPAGAEVGEIVIATDEHVTWADGGKNLTGKVSVFGRLTVHDYELRYNISRDGEASFWVLEGGLLEFDNVTLLHDNQSARFFFKVEGRFVARRSEFDWLTGQFATGGGIKVVGGELEMDDCHLHDFEVQGIYVEGDGSSAILDNCTLNRTQYDRELDMVQYGIHAKDGGEVTLRNGCLINNVSRAGVLVNHAEADISNTTVVTDRSHQTQGIAARGSELRVADSRIHECKEEGIELADGSSGDITNCHIWNCTVGIRLSSSSADILSCSVDSCLDGLNIYLSDPTLRACHLTDNFNGVSSRDCVPNYTLEDCTIGGNSQYGVYAMGKGFHESGTRWTDDQGNPNTIARVIQWWTLDVNVTDRDLIPVVGAEVTVRAANGTLVHNGTTDSLGGVRNIDLVGHDIGNDGTLNAREPYRVRIEEERRSAEKRVTMDTNRILTVQLGDEPKLTDSPLLWIVSVIAIVVIVAAVGYWWRFIR